MHENEILEILFLNKLINDQDSDDNHGKPRIQIQFLIWRRKCLQIMITNGLSY